MKNNWPDNLTIQQYLDGSLDKKLMHELEKRALEDPFLADALEGYAQTSTPNHGLSILQRQLHERIMHQQENKKVFDLSWQRLSIAAAAAVMFIASGVLFWMNGQVPEQKLAGNPKQVEVRVTPIDSLIEEQEVVAVSSPKLEPIKIAEASALKRAKGIARPRIESKMAISSSTAPLTSQDLIEKSQETRISDKQADIFRAARAKRVEGLALNDSVAKAVNFPSQKPLSEISKNSFAGDSQQNVQTEGVQAYKKYIEENLFKASPAGGWEAFRTYLKANIVRTATTVNQKGKVVVGFKVNQLGDLTDFKVLKGLSAGADSLAVQFIKNGPAWKTVSDVKVADLRVELDF